MSKYSQDYFFIEKEKDLDGLPFLKADASTANRKFSYQRQQPGTPPLTFYNCWKEQNAKEGIEPIRNLPNV
ncbi:hypothetical protein AB835_14550 [Candidatus Endobugula sertula]|uniref:Uncharacterized protein n=1 Tax=Candidatus Endobugula sertula TaxID=62101 RepID=A0A1D2QLC5_9GAMM|nr:hypothetical protein AB835_14550 [Candidatus Endobugula sertula]